MCSVADKQSDRENAVRTDPEQYEQCVTEELTQSMRGLFDSAYEGIRVLVVDDEPNDRNRMKTFFRKKGIRAQAISRVERVWEMVKMFDPHFIILDIAGVDDFEKIFQTFKDRIIICTGLNGDMDNRISREAMACFSKEDLNKVVQYVINKSKVVT